MYAAAEGSEATPVAPDWFGGGGGGSSWSMAYWLWPLPPVGPLSFIAEWPAYGIGESRATVDAGALRREAEHADVLWTS